ncbi:hypothetical protein [Streptomyces sp. NPDC003036]
MSTKSHPGDGQYARGSKGALYDEPRRSVVAAVRAAVRHLTALRQR